MGKFIIFLGALFTLLIISPVGKLFTDAVTNNYTFSYITGNLSSIGWYVAYMRSYWWIMPLMFIVALIVWFMKKEEPEPYFPQMQAPRMPRQPKPVKQKRVVQPKPKPPIFFGGGRP